MPDRVLLALLKRLLSYSRLLLLLTCLYSHATCVGLTLKERWLQFHTGLPSGEPEAVYK